MNEICIERFVVLRRSIKVCIITPQFSAAIPSPLGQAEGDDRVFVWQF
jgi:hypothetical protein